MNYNRRGIVFFEAEEPEENPSFDKKNKKEKEKKLKREKEKEQIVIINKVEGWFFLFLFWLILSFLFMGLSSGIYFIYKMYQTLPSLGQMQHIEQPLVSKVLSKDGELIYEFATEKRYYIPLEKIPVKLRQAVVAIEDRKFYKHWGIDLKRIGGAIIVNIIRKQYAQGASTITQQLARNVYLTAHTSLIRKIREALTAIQLESCYTKDEILELYLNQVYLGAGMYGVEAASIYYFNKKASELDLNECAVLAGLIQLPEKYRPDKEENLPRMKERRNKVLKAMLEMKMIDKETYQRVSQESIKVNIHQKYGGIAPYFIEMVRKYVSDKYGDELLLNGGLTIYTTLDPVAQDSAERSCARQIANLQRRLNYLFIDSSNADKILKIKRDFFLEHFDSIYAVHKDKFKDLPDSLKLRQAQIAVLALDVPTGAIRVLIGGRNFQESKFNRAIMAKRQPGSAFKPFVYAAALDNGFTPASVVLDQPITLVTPDGEWRPENYDKVFNGPITIRKALAKSVNLVAIQVLNKIGAETVINYARRMGLKQEMKPVPALAIGACEATLMELTSAYSAFANHGIRAKPYFIEKIVDKNGRVLESHTHYEEEVLSPRTAYLMCSLLRTVVCCGTGASIPALGFTRPAAGKTGTTNEYSDAWFIGFTPQIVCGVWAGVDEKRSLGAGVTGTVAAIPVWVRTMIPLHRNIKPTDFKVPEGIKTEMICEESHLLATPKCPSKVMEVFFSETVLDTCDIHGGSKKENMMRLFDTSPQPQKKTPSGQSGEKKSKPLMF